MATHELKTWMPYFEDVASGKKNFEVRKNDRNFQVGDIVILREWSWNTGGYTSRGTGRIISYVLAGGKFGIETGYCVLGLSAPSQVLIPPPEERKYIVRDLDFRKIYFGGYVWHVGKWRASQREALRMGREEAFTVAKREGGKVFRLKGKKK